jgi:uncharacterized protein with ParB-like and HNH nuclease domain
MREILGKAKTVRELLKGVKYSIDYYQREYKWHEKQIRELVDDLSDKFLEEYQPTHPRSKIADYPHYFLGSIIISKKESVGYIVDASSASPVSRCFWSCCAICRTGTGTRSM